MPPSTTTLTGRRLGRVLASSLILLAPIAASGGGPDFRISHATENSNNPKAVYNPVEDEFLVVWSGDSDLGTGIDNQIWAQRIDAATGTEIGADFRISDEGERAFSPEVVYNPVDHEYLVVWQDDETEGVADYEVFVQRLDAATGESLGSTAIVSTMGPAGDAAYKAENPAVVYNPLLHEYLVVWEGDDDRPSSGEGEDEIWGQRLDAATGLEIGEDDFRISDMDPPPSAELGDAGSPSVAFNPLSNEYLVVWFGDDLFDNEFEIWGQRLDGVSGLEVGVDDFRISDLGVDRTTFSSATASDVVFDAASGEYLVVFAGNSDSTPAADNETHVWGQRLDADGNEVGPNDFKISQHDQFFSNTPRVALEPASQRLLVTWASDFNQGSGGDFNVFTRTLVASETGVLPLAPETELFPGAKPSLALDPTRNRFLLVWDGETLEQVDDVWGRFVSLPPRLALSGSCPGTLELTATGGTPNASLFVLAAAAKGSDPIPGGRCQGQPTDLLEPTLFRRQRADEMGAAVISVAVHAGRCSSLLQAVDAATCLTSDVVTIPPASAGGPATDH